MTWNDLTVILALVGMAVVQAYWSLSFASRRDRQAACRPHRWRRIPGGGLVCESCGAVPGRVPAAEQ